MICNRLIDVRYLVSGVHNKACNLAAAVASCYAAEGSDTTMRP